MKLQHHTSGLAVGQFVYTDHKNKIGGDYDRCGKILEIQGSSIFDSRARFLCENGCSYSAEALYFDKNHPQLIPHEPYFLPNSSKVNPNFPKTLYDVCGCPKNGNH